MSLPWSNSSAWFAKSRSSSRISTRLRRAELSSTTCWTASASRSSRIGFSMKSDAPTWVAATGSRRLVSRDEQQRKVLFTGQLTKLPAKVETVHVLQLDLDDRRRELDGRCLVEGFEARAATHTSSNCFSRKSGSGAPYLSSPSTIESFRRQGAIMRRACSTCVFFVA